VLALKNSFAGIDHAFLAVDLHAFLHAWWALIPRHHVTLNLGGFSEHLLARVDLHGCALSSLTTRLASALTLAEVLLLPVSNGQ
jgi:hypothetical protein